MKSPHILFVCILCAKNSNSGDQSNKCGGEKLFEQLQTLHQNWSLREYFAIQPVKCMGTCDHPCAISFIGFGKFTYLFGDLPSDDASLNTTASTVLDCATQHYNHPEGLLPYRDRPELLRNTIIAKIPPLQ